MIHGLQESKQSAPFRIVVIHPDLLADNPLLFLHSLLGEIGGLDKIKKNFKGLLKMIRTGKKITSKEVKALALAPVFA